MRLYLWTEVLKEYSYGVAFAIAESEEEARAVIIEVADPWDRDELRRDLEGFAHPYDSKAPLTPNPPQVIELDQPFGFSRYGGA